VLPSSWANWADFFKQAGYAPLTPDWPDDPATVDEARANPDVLSRKTLKQVADHTTEVISALDKKPVVMGHSTGGLLAQMLAGRGLSAATVAIDPGVFRGVLPLPISVLRSSGPFLVNPLTRRRAITLTFKQFTYGWANALDEDEARELYEKFHVAGSGVALAQMGNANLNPWTQAKVNTSRQRRWPPRSPASPDRKLPSYPAPLRSGDRRRSCHRSTSWRHRRIRRRGSPPCHSLVPFLGADPARTTGPVVLVGHSHGGGLERLADARDIIGLV
jgi:alpha-beta hydrolase superfamily lysophospholipase